MKYLVDANVLSEPTQPDPDPRVIEWLRTNEAELDVNPVILGELRFGILILPEEESELLGNIGSTPAPFASTRSIATRTPA